MIDDSVPWRQELMKSAWRLRRWNTQKRWTSRTYFNAERDIMMGAYSIRRLIDSKKSSSLLARRRIPTRRYALIGRVPLVLDRFDPERFYDIGAPTNSELEVGWLCNQIIHSFIFQLYLEDDSTTSALFVSDHDRGKHLHGLPFATIADLFDYVAREDVVERYGTMVDGEERIVNLSNHDAVESGRAVYADNDRVIIQWTPEEIPAFDQRILDMVARRCAEQRTTSGFNGTQG